VLRPIQAKVFILLPTDNGIGERPWSAGMVRIAQVRIAQVGCRIFTNGARENKASCCISSKPNAEESGVAGRKGYRGQEAIAAETDFTFTQRSRIKQ